MDRQERKERERAAARRAILEAAASAFARRGYHGTKVEDVAREAGYSASSLYTYFKGKDSLYESLLVEVAAEFEAVKREPILPSLAYRERFEWVIRRQLEIVEKNRDFFVVFASQRGGIELVQDTGADELTRTNYLGWVEFMAGFIQQGMDEGHVRAGDARDFAYFVIGSINAAIFRWVAGDLTSPLQGHVLTLLDFLGSGLFRDPNGTSVRDA
jgi:AcrR family transcriptional regulator